MAYYTTASDGGAALHFEHQDWLGTERMRTAYNGSVEGSYASLPYGDGQTTSGTDTDANHVAMLDFDSESDTDHAQYRQYSPTEGRWLRPDPYSGSYHFRNPQSLNRYVYSMNSPLSKIDPSGLDNEWSPDEAGEDYTDDGGWGGDGGFSDGGFGGYSGLVFGYTPSVPTVAPPSPDIPTDPPNCIPNDPTPYCQFTGESQTFNLQGREAQNAVFAQVDSSSGNGGNGSAPNNPTPTPQQKHVKDCATLQRLSTGEGRISDGFLVAGTVAVGSIVVTGGLDAPAAAPVGLAFGLGSGTAKGVQWLTKIVANNFAGCNIVLSTD